MNKEKDDCYTPNKILVKVGQTLYDLLDRIDLDIVNPQGWCYLKSDNELKGSCIQLEIVNNNSDGRDSHIRQIEIYSYVNKSSFSNEMYSCSLSNL